MGKYFIKLYAGNGEVVQQYINADITQFPQADYPLTFKMSETTEGRVILRKITTTLPAIIEEVIEHSGMLSV